MASNSKYDSANIPELETNLSDVQGNIKTAQSGLANDMGGTNIPSYSSLTAQQSLQKLKTQAQTINDAILQKKWYPKEVTGDAPVENVNPGIVGKTLDALQTPLYGVVGATRHLVGQGTSNTLLGDVKENIATGKRTFGDVLKQAGAPTLISGIGGFALDIMADPFNWATAGTTALIPKMAYGAIKGAEEGTGILKGVGLAAKSRGLEVLNTTATIAKHIVPSIAKTETYADLGKAALYSQDAWEKMTGATVDKLVSQSGFGVSSWRKDLGTLAGNAVKSLPYGDTLLDTWRYDNKDWMQQAQLKNLLKQTLSSSDTDIVDIMRAVEGGAPEKQLSEMVDRIANTKGKKLTVVPGGSSLLTEMEKSTKPIVTSIEELKQSLAEKLAKRMDDAAEIQKNPEIYMTMDKAEIGQRMYDDAIEAASSKFGGQAKELMAKLMQEASYNNTGVKWFDDVNKSVRQYKLAVGANQDKVLINGEKIMGAYDKAMSLFRIAKISASPSAYTNAVGGNMIMAHMAGESIGDLGFMSRLNQVWNLYKNKPGSAVQIESALMSLDDGGQLFKQIEEHLPEFKSTMGDAASFIGAGAKTSGLKDVATKELYDRLKLAGQIEPGMDYGQFTKSVLEARDEAKKWAKEVAAKVNKGSRGIEAGTKLIRDKLAAGEVIDKSEIGSGIISQEVLGALSEDKSAREFLAKIKTKADEGGVGWKALNLMFNKMPSGFESIDQTFKMTSFIRSTVDGYTLPQLQKIKNLVELNPENLTKFAKDGVYRYRLPADKALELANETFLNYAAMPAGIKVLRNMPVLGSPFASFMYGMAIKTGKTMLYNPGAFNKVSFALNEFGGTKTPMEKSMIYDTSNPSYQYYSYLSKPGSFRIPFFDQNPAYLNLANLIPYYSMNMFNPTQSNYDTSLLPGKLASMLQSSPFMKDPVGQYMFNYLIQPMILGDSIAPQGSFGQQLYPTDATGLEKAAYGLRDLTESFVPNVAEYAGIPAGLMGMPQQAIEYTPSYKFRSLSRAVQGLNPVGKSTKEPALSKTVRGISGTIGLPVSPSMDLTYNQATNK